MTDLIDDTTQRLGSMTPEELQALEGIDEEAVNRIQHAINRFYGQEYNEEAPAQDLIEDSTEVPGEISVEIVEA